MDSRRDVRGACRRAAVLLGLAVLFACGGRAPDATSPGAEDPGSTQPGEPGAGEPAAAPEPGEPSGQAAIADAVTEAECQALLAHLVAVANAAHVQTVAPEQAPTEEQLAEIRARMRPEFMPMCLSLERSSVECQMRAQTRDELLACAN